jgi:GNAT superfamily N-acetyltransferase
VSSEASTEQLFVGGVPVLSFVPVRQALPTADEAVAIGDLDVVVPEVLTQLAGCWFSSPDDTLIDALLARGATVVRHSHVMVYDVRRHRPVHDGPAVPVVPIDRPSAGLAELSVRAYPSSHVDFETAVVAEVQADIDAMLQGTVIGPFMASASGIVIDDGRPVAVLIVNRVPQNPVASGPWVSELFRDPDPAHRGLGTVLLDHAIRALCAAGEVSLSLAVTDGNPAISVYERLGFDTVTSRRKLLIPPT